MFSFIKRSSKSEAPQSLDELLGLEAISNGIVRHKGQYILIVEVTPINFRLKSESEQCSIIERYNELLRVLKCAFQITTIARPADITVHTRYMEKILDNEQDEALRAHIVRHIEFVRAEASHNALSRNFILAIPYIPPAGTNPQTVTEERAISALMELKSRVRELFSACGNELVETDHPDRHIAGLLYTLLNRQSSQTQTLPLLR